MQMGMQIDMPGTRAGGFVRPPFRLRSGSPSISQSIPSRSRAGRMPPPTSSFARFIWLLGLLWLAGIAIRVPILGVPPLLPLLHDDLGLSQTQAGLLIGLPSAMFAVAAVPGSLLVARIGVGTTLILGLILTALASAGRGAAGNVWL